MKAVVARAKLQFGDWTNAVPSEGEVELFIVHGVAVPMIASFRKMAHALYPDLSEHKAEVRWAARVGWKFMEKNVGELRRQAEDAALVRTVRDGELAEAHAAYEKSLTEETCSDTGKGTAPSP